MRFLRQLPCVLSVLIATRAIAVPGVQGFIENRGQLPPPVRYYAVLPRGLLYITDRGYGYVWYNTEPRTERLHAHRVEVQTTGNQRTQLRPNLLVPTTLNFYRGSTRLEGVRVYRQVMIDSIAPGVTAAFSIQPNGTIKCDYRAVSTRSASALAFSIRGAPAHVLPDGRLAFRTRFGDIIESAPISFRTSAIPVKTTYVLERNILRFAIEDPDASAPVTVDPEIEWSSYAGGSAQDQWAHVQTDAERNILVIGRTQSVDFPTKFGFSASLRGDYDAIIAKYRADGTLLWATYYGGTRREIHNLDHCDLAVERAGTVLVAGCTQSDDLPLTSGAFQHRKASSMPSGYDLFLAQLSPSGQLLWASYCGGNDNEDVFALATDRQGNAYLVGHTSSDDFPASVPRPTIVSPKRSTSQDVFVLKLSPERTPQWVYFIGGSATEVATGAVCDRAGSLYVCGYTQSADFPTAGTGIYQSIKTAANDGFLFKLDGLGRLQWSTLIGGNGEDYCSSVSLDSSFDRRLILGGTTSSTDMWYRGAGKRTLGGNGDGFLAAFDPQTGNAQWVHYHGGSSYDELTALAVDPDNNIIVVGRTLGDYPTIAAQQPTYHGGGGDMFIAKLAPDGTPQWATYAGGSFLDRATDIAIDGNTNFIVVGHSSSADFPIIGTSAQPRLGNLTGTDDGVLLKFCNIAIPSALVSAAPEFCQGESRTLSVVNRGSSVQYDSYQWERDGQPIPDATNQTYTTPATLEAGMYRFVCRVTNTARCPAVTDTVVVRIHAPPQIGERSFAICSGDPLRLDSIPISGAAPFRYEWTGTPPPSDPSAPNPTVHPDHTTTYTLRVTDANGCNAERTFTVLVFPVSRVPLTVHGDRSFCEGDSAVLELTASFGAIRWNTGERSPHIVVRTNGRYFAAVELPGGCIGYSDTVEIAVRPHPQPLISYDGTLLSTTVAYDSYQWLLDGTPIPGATDRFLEPPRIGTYTVIVDSGGCSGVSQPVDIALTAQVHLTIGSARAAIGERVRIPLLLSTTQQLARVGASRLMLQLRYNASVLFMLESSAPVIERFYQPDGTATVTLAVTDVARDTVATLEFLALWGNAEHATISVLRATWNAPTVTTTWSDGVVTIEGLCTSGGTRLFEDTGAFGIRAILPQPGADIITVIATAIEDAPHRLVLTATDGRRWPLGEQFLRAGTYAFALAVDRMPPGRYELAFESATLVATSPLVIVR
ncbi:hypothetical protein HRbin20_00885 [bacterium HR20]|nr:hypothetical protein HRbin20_00885 [bacterium HR20]